MQVNKRTLSAWT